eukprot:Gb_25853 [translate_table: standard]
MGCLGSTGTALSPNHQPMGLGCMPFPHWSTDDDRSRRSAPWRMPMNKKSACRFATFSSSTPEHSSLEPLLFSSFLISFSDPCSILRSSHYLLTNLLLENMKATASKTGIEGRIVNVSSEGHKFAYWDGIRFDKINDRSGYYAFLAYGQSKLANILHSNELTRQLQGAARESSCLQAQLKCCFNSNANIFLRRKVGDDPQFLPMPGLLVAVG